MEMSDSQIRRYMDIFEKTGDYNYILRLLKQRIEDNDRIRASANKCRDTLNNLYIQYYIYPYLEIIQNLECNLDINISNDMIINELENYNLHLLKHQVRR